MLVFSSMTQARRYGFSWVEYQPERHLHLVEIIRVRRDGLRERGLAWAREKDFLRESHEG